MISHITLHFFALNTVNSIQNAMEVKTKENNCHSFNTQYKEKDNTHSLNEWMKGWDRATQGNLTSPNTYIQRRSRGFAGVTECWYLSFLFHRSIDTGNK